MGNRITSYPGVYDKDMNTKLYLVGSEAEITEAQYNAIKEGYGVTGPDFQIIKDGTKYYLRGDVEDVNAIKAIVDSYLVEAGAKPVFNTESNTEDKH